MPSHTYTFTPSGDSELPIDQHARVMDSGMKLENPEETHGELPMDGIVISCEASSPCCPLCNIYDFQKNHEKSIQSAILPGRAQCSYSEKFMLPLKMKLAHYDTSFVQCILCFIALGHTGLKLLFQSSTEMLLQGSLAHYSLFAWF